MICFRESFFMAVLVIPIKHEAPETTGYTIRIGPSECAF